MARKAGAGSHIVISGIKDIDRKLGLLPDKITKNVLRKAMREALKPVKSAVEKEAPVRKAEVSPGKYPHAPGQIGRSVKIKGGKRKKGSMRLVVRIGAGDFLGDSYYAAMVEYGTKYQPAQHYMRWAMKRTAQFAKEEAEFLIREGAEREIEKLGKT